MRSSQILSLFSDRPEVSQRPSSFVASILAHIAAVAVLVFGVAYRPEIRDPALSEHLSVRHLDLHMPDPTKRAQAGSEVAYPGPRHEEHTPSPGGSEPALRKIAQAEPGPQTLVQPDIPNPVKLKEKIPVPTIVIWTPKKTVAKTLVSPLPEKPTAADVNPVVDLPNEELNLADLSISSTNARAVAPHVIASTTSPMVVHGPDQVQLPPATASQTTSQPTPAAVMSVSDVQMREGTVNLPPVNETLSTTSQGTQAQGPSADSSQTGKGNAQSTASGIGSGKATGSPGELSKAGGKLNGDKPGTGKTAMAGSGSGDLPNTHRITLPINGQFDSVIVGNMVEDKYPDAAEVWNGRMAYTVFLHVGVAKSWILQYSLPSGEDAKAAGNVSRLEAPWPYNIVRPNLSPDAINADALIIHGFVNQAGRFERLAVAFPSDFEQAQFVLAALQQWQFRPAAQNGQSELVEVVLIIPEDLN
jgi:hypothetical protein